MSTHFTRRNIATLAAAGTLAGLSETTGVAQTSQGVDTRTAQPATPGFPNGFYWGTGTSSYQIEGAWNEDGKGPSIWDTYAHTPGNIKNGDTGDVANDHYHRYKEDVALMKDFGANAYRFSIAWPRIFPNGTGQPNPKGVDFYSRLVDELVAAGIAPFPTLYHWDLPQALQDKGGWQNRDTVKAFADYAGYMAEKLSDRVGHFFTINEFRSFVDIGHRGKEVTVPGGSVTLAIAPGLKLPPGAPNQVRHHAALAHGMAVQALRRHQRLQAGHVRVGLRYSPRMARYPLCQGASDVVVPVAHDGPRGVVLGAEIRAVAVERQRNPHHRERLRDTGCHCRGRQYLRHRPHHVPSRLPHPAPASCRRRRPCEGLLPVERNGQLRVDGRLRQPLRPCLRGLRDAEADAETQCLVLPRNSTAKCGCLGLGATSFQR
jgi:Glycosyl hydrolase family 1